MLQILSSLPEDLNKTYDLILSEIAEHNRGYASMALHWLVLSAAPLFVEEWIDACSVSLTGSSLTAYGPSVDWRLRPQELLSLLPNLVSIEPAIPFAKSKDYEMEKHRVVLSHFSVKEYLLGTQVMAPNLREAFLIEPALGHQLLAQACIAYLYRTNGRSQKGTDYPLHRYAWDFWTFHCVSVDTASDRVFEEEVIELADGIASGELLGQGTDSGLCDTTLLGLRKLDKALSQLPDGVDKADVLDSLRRPCRLGDSSAEPLSVYDAPMDAHREIRLIEVLPSSHRSTPIRCRLIISEPSGPHPYEAVSYAWGPVDRKQWQRVAWVEDNCLRITRNLSQILRELRLSHEKRRLWIAFVSFVRLFFPYRNVSWASRHVCTC